MLTDERIQLRSTAEAWERLWLLIHLSPGEVGGLASVQADGAGYVITAVHLIDQRATDVDNELDPGAVSRFLIAHLKAGGNPGELRLWWHSHGREGVFWSADDQRTIDRFGGELLISLVGNHAGKFLARLDRFEPARQTVGWVDFIPLGPPPAVDNATAARVSAELAQHVEIVPRHTNKPWTDGDELPRHRRP